MTAAHSRGRNAEILWLEAPHPPSRAERARGDPRRCPTSTRTSCHARSRGCSAIGTWARDGILHSGLTNLPQSARQESVLARHGFGSKRIEGSNSGGPFCRQSRLSRKFSATLVDENERVVVLSKPEIVLVENSLDFTASQWKIKHRQDKVANYLQADTGHRRTHMPEV